MIRYLEEADPERAEIARHRYTLLDHVREPQTYGYQAAFGLRESARHAVVQQLLDLRAAEQRYLERDGRPAADSQFMAERNGVVVVNAEKIALTGHKREDKTYFRHTGYPGGVKKRTAQQILESAHPERVIEKAVYGMLPKTALGRQVLRGKLRVYAGAEHPHAPQQPKTLTLPKSEAK